MAKGCPLSSAVVSNIFTEHSEEMAHVTAKDKALFWHQYVDDTIMV
jgi:hypothetical protein